MVISHNSALLETVNKVFHLDAERTTVTSTTSAGRSTWSSAAPTPAAATGRRSARHAAVLVGGRRTDAGEGDQGQGGAEHAPSAAAAGRSGRERREQKVAKLRFPSRLPCGKTPPAARGLSKSHGSLEVFADVDMAVDRGPGSWCSG